jgi:hypothetical protein
VSANESVILFNSPDMIGNKVQIGSDILDIEEVGRVTKELLAKVTKNMDHLLFGQDIFALPDDLAIYDEPQSRQPGYGFVDDDRNGWKSTKTVLEYIVTSPLVLARFGQVDSQGKIIWYPGACQKYLEDIHLLQNCLFVATLFTLGQPARGTEFCMCLLRNICGGSVQNVFWLFGVFALRGSYNKTSHATQRDHAMARIPLPCIGRLWVRFLVYLRPLFEEWQCFLRPHMANNARYYLLAALHRPTTTTDLSKVVEIFFRDHFKMQMTLGKYRQAMAFITECNRDLFDAAEASTSAAQEQFGHSGERNRLNYGLNAQLPEGLDRSLFMKTARVSAAQHILFGHEPELLAILEAGNGRRMMLAGKIRAFRRPQAVSVETNSTQASICISMQHLVEGITAGLAPVLANHNNIQLARACSMVVEHCGGAEATLAPVSRERKEAHPYVLGKLREFMKDMTSMVGFTNVHQVEVTQYMYEGDRHVGYIAATGVRWAFVI